MHGGWLAALLVGASVAGAGAQLALTWSTGEKTDNCPVWSPFGPCLWLKSSNLQAPYASK